MIIPGRNDKYKWKNKSNKKWLPAWYFAENMGYYTIDNKMDYSLFCNSVYFSCFDGKNMLWFSFIHDLNFISLCSKLIIIDYHTPKQRKIKFKPRIKLNHKKYPHFPKLNYRFFSRSLFISLRKQITLNDHSPLPPTTLQTLLTNKLFLRLNALFLQDCQLSMEPAFLNTQRFPTISIVVLCTGPARHAYCITKQDWLGWTTWVLPLITIVPLLNMYFQGNSWQYADNALESKKVKINSMCGLLAGSARPSPIKSVTVQYVL